jgi:hypothetical protein
VSSADANARDRNDRPEERIGRRLGIGLFWLLAVYMIGMSAASIIPALYWPDAAPRPRALSAARCAQQIHALERDLLAKVADSVQRGSLTGLERWLLMWDGRSLALAGGCGPLEPARKDLLRLRADLGSLLASYRSRSLRVQQRLQRALEHWPLHGAERPKS